MLCMLSCTVDECLYFLFGYKNIHMPSERDLPNIRRGIWHTKIKETATGHMGITYFGCLEEMGPTFNTPP